MIRRLSVFRLALLAAAFLAGLAVLFFYIFRTETGNQAPGRETRQDVVRVVYLPIGPDLPLFVALDEGLFEKHGLNVIPVRATDSAVALELLWSKSADATCIMELFAVFAHEDKSPGDFRIHLMAAADRETRVHHLLVRRGARITKPVQLRGRRLGHFPGTQMKMFNRLVLEKLEPGLGDSVELVPLPPQAQLDALASGQVDAVFSLEPIKTLATSQGLADVLIANPLYELVLKPFPTAASLLSTRLIEERPDVARRFVAAIEESVTKTESDPTAARRALAKWTGIPPEAARKVGIYRYWTRPRIDLGAVRRYLGLLEAEGLLSRTIDPQPLLYKE